MLAILDYGAGNQTSVKRALGRLGIESVISSDPGEISRCAGLIFPGVGAAPQAMERLRESGMDQELKKAVQRGQPLLGVCLGCQILLEESAEGPTRTLGIVKGRCERFREGLREEDGSPVRIPHMGWNGLRRIRHSPLLEGIPEGAEFYFVHGYHALPEEGLIIAMSHYGRDFCALYGRDGLWGAQFHPEKSGEPGLRLLKNFNAHCEARNAV